MSSGKIPVNTIIHEKQNHCMTKYSVGPRDDEDPNEENSSCAMCGSTDDLRVQEVAGAEVTVCSDCRDSDDTRSRSDSQEESDNSSQSSTDSGSESTGYTITDPDSSWVEEDRPDYGNTETPYLVPNYVDKVQDSLDNTDATVEDMAEETGLHVETVEALTDGNAVSAGVGKKAVEAIENYLGVEIQEDI